MEKQHDFGHEDGGHAAQTGGPAGCDREAAAGASRLEEEDLRPVFDWQAILLRYLPDPPGTEHAIKRFGLR